MVLDTPISIIEFGFNVGFMIISFLIIIIFLNRFEGKVEYRKPSIAGFILMSLGLSFHILGNLLAQLLSETQVYLDGLNHFIAAFISLSVLLFIMGTSLILYHTVNDKNKSKVKLFGYFFLVLGIIDTLYNFVLYFTSEDYQPFDLEPEELQAIYLGLEMIVLTIIYILLLIQSRRSVSKIVSIRYQLIAITSIGYVLVILADLSIKLSLIEFASTMTFFIFFFLHILTVGALYLLVLFPEWYQKMRGLSGTI